MAFDEGKFMQIMLFYSVLTYYVGPKVAKSMKLDTKDPCMVGMVMGFAVCMGLWKQYGYNMSYGSGKY